MVEVAAAPSVAPSVAVASQWQLMWWAFRRHRLAMVGLVVTIVLYVIAAVPGFFADQRSLAAERPRGLSTRREAIHFLDRNGPAAWSLRV